VPGSRGPVGDRRRPELSEEPVLDELRPSLLDSITLSLPDSLLDPRSSSAMPG